MSKEAKIDALIRAVKGDLSAVVSLNAGKLFAPLVLIENEDGSYTDSRTKEIITANQLQEKQAYNTRWGINEPVIYVKPESGTKTGVRI